MKHLILATSILGLAICGCTKTSTDAYNTMSDSETQKENTVKNETSSKNSVVDSKSVTGIDAKTFNLNGVEFKMIFVEGSTFTMGANNRQENEAPAHQVTVSDYYIGETEVTQPLWKNVMGENPSYRTGDNYPVENLTWKICHSFVDKLTTIARYAGILTNE